jgi:glycosyltransferase involved in cell wall biosynthesis
MIETPMVRVTWEDKPMLEDVTVLICQYKTYDLIRLTVESLLVFYPTIKIVVADNSPEDRSGQWLRYKSAKYPNIQVVRGDKSHGVAMHTAIMRDVQTKYVLLLDSDVIFKRGGVIEMMRQEIKLGGIVGVHETFATGSLMNVTRKNHACGDPQDENDVLRYIHPSCGMYDVEIYKSMEAEFVDHGAPCVYPTLEAEEKGYKVVGVNVGDYVMHLSGASWTEPRTVWEWDFGVFMRPLLTFVNCFPDIQSDNDYDMIATQSVITGNFVIHDKEPKRVHSNLFTSRFDVRGDYVCMRHPIGMEFVKTLRGIATKNPTADILDVAGIPVYSRRYFQSTIAWE